MTNYQNYWCVYVHPSFKSCLQKSELYKFGERGSGLRPRGEPQDFQKIRTRCLQQGILFEDPEFPAEDSSIFYSRSPPKPFEWKRPHELCEDPRLFVEGASRFDVRQGELGDCWLLAAVANLTLNHALFVRVVPDDQTFTEEYAGVFHFRFWQYGRWVDVVVDDRLPTYYGRLVFMHSTERNEFWSALLEKAYAKLHGSYEALKGGTTCEAMEDFTGGVTEMYELDKAPQKLFHILLKAYERSSLMGCSVEPDPNICEAEMPNGLIKGHAYSITRVKMVDIQTPRVSGKIPLIRLRNPWGNEAEWKGAWSDRSPEWRFIPDGEKQELGLTFESDGEFWMSFQDFKSNFQRLEICNLDPDSLEEDLLPGSNKKWESSVFEGSWSRGVTAGGCRNYLDTFWYNPQYRVVLEDPDDDDDDDDEDKGKCTAIVALMQKNRRTMRKMGVECLTIGFAIYHLENPDTLPKPLDKNFFKYNASVARSQAFINLREVSCRFKLAPGTYCIVPSTFEANEEGEFVLRVFSEKKNNMQELDSDIGLDKPDEDDKAKPATKGSGQNTRTIIRARTEPDRDAKEAMKEVFRKISGDDMEIDHHELKEVLDLALKREFKFNGFSIDVCRSMVAMMDVDRSGKLGFEEFLELWTDVLTWKKIFQTYDKDNSQRLTTFELRTALQSAGYHLNWHILKALVLRYGEKDNTLSFDSFIMCAVKLKCMIAMFKDKDTRGTNEATFSLEEWVEKTMYS